MKTLHEQPLEVQAATMVAGFAQELGLQPGNMWEPPMARKIATALAVVNDPELAKANYTLTEEKFRFLLGLEPINGPLIPVSRL